MAICLKHNQCYNISRGEYCPYCGKPEKKASKDAWEIKQRKVKGRG